MANPIFVVTGATGKTGGAVVDQLLAKGLPVRAVVHRRDARSDALDRKGAETVVADMFDPDQLLDALRGTQRAYYVPFFHTHMIQSAAAFGVAATEAKLEAVVQMSQWLSQPAHPAIMTRQTWLVDRMFAQLPGVAHTIVNPGMFADNFLRVIDFASLLGMFPVLSGDGEAAPVSNEDMARVVVAVLLGPERHAGKTYRPTGPRLLTGRSMAEIIAKVVGHRVVKVPLPFWMFTKVARRQRINPLEISGFRYYMEEMRRGAFAVGGVTSVVQDLTGIPAESFETTARRYAAMPFARPRLANRLKAIFDVTRTPFLPGYDLGRWELQMGLPMPARPSFSIDDDRWRTERGLPPIQDGYPAQPPALPRLIEA